MGKNTKFGTGTGNFGTERAMYGATLHLPGPDLLEGDLDTGPHQAQHGVQDLQQGRRLEDLQGAAGHLVQAVNALPGRQVRDRLVEEVAPASRLDGVVGHKVGSAHGVLQPNVR